MGLYQGLHNVFCVFMVLYLSRPCEKGAALEQFYLLSLSARLSEKGWRWSVGIHPKNKNLFMIVISHVAVYNFYTLIQIHIYVTWYPCLLNTLHFVIHIVNVYWTNRSVKEDLIYKFLLLIFIKHVNTYEDLYRYHVSISIHNLIWYWKNIY